MKLNVYEDFLAADKRLGDTAERVSVIAGARDHPYWDQ